MSQAIRISFYTDQAKQIGELLKLSTSIAAHAKRGNRLEDKFQPYLREIKDIITHFLQKHKAYVDENEGKTPVQMLAEYVRIADQNHWQVFESDAERELFAFIEQLPAVLKVILETVGKIAVSRNMFAHAIREEIANLEEALRTLAEMYKLLVQVEQKLRKNIHL